MSRKGKQPIPVPKGVEINAKDGLVTVKGPKGTLQQKIAQGIALKHEGDVLYVEPIATLDDADRLHGLYRSLIGNMVVGVSQGFEKQLELIGVGYRAAVQGSLLDLQLGFSHPMQLPISEGLAIKIEKNIITVSGIDKQLVGEYCAKIRAVRPPEPYQGKGVRYKDEYVRRKQGKASGKK
jgi:large subunit ribosomal protein L6